MDLSKLPNRDNDIIAAIEEAQKEGPSALVELAILCLWLVGQRSDPRRVNTGPNGLRPLDHLLAVLLQNEVRGEPVSEPNFLAKSFPKPSSPLRDRVPEAEARQQVTQVLSEANHPSNSRRKLFLWCNGLSKLAQAGIGSEHLQPLIRSIIDNWSEKEDSFGYAPRALFYAGELQEGKKILKRIPVSSYLGATIRLRQDTG